MFKILLFVCLFFSSIFFISPVITKASDVEITKSGLKTTATNVGAFNTNVNHLNYFTNKVGTIIGTVLSFVGILFLGLIIYAGLMWMTASGNEQQVTKAKSLLINATIGIIIVFGAYAITAFIGNNFLK